MKYTILVREAPVCIAHQLKLPYDSKCNNLHGHNYVVTAKLGADDLDNNGMVADFSAIKAVIKRYDHKFLGNLVPQQIGEDGKEAQKALYSILGIDGTASHVEPSTAENFVYILFEEIQAAVPQGVKVLEVRLNETPSTEVIYRG